MTYSWKLNVYRSWDEVDDPSFIEQWNGWMHESTDVHVFNHPVMVKAWTDTYRRLWHIEPLYIVARAQGVSVMLPLILWRRNWKNAWIRVIVPAGYSDFDYHEPVIVAENTDGLISSFWSMLEDWILGEGFGGCDKVELTGMRYPGTNAWKPLPDVCPYVSLAGYQDYQDYLSTLKKSLRQDIGRQKRRLAQNGSLRYHAYSPSITDDALDSFRLFMDTHAEKWPGAYKAPGLHECVFRTGSEAGLVHFSELRLDNKPISWHFGFLYRDRFYYYMPSYLNALSNYSPSKVHLSFLVEECFERGVAIFDHLRGMENYKHGWAGESASLYGFDAFSPSLLSRFKLSAFNRLQDFRK
ncbi:MAG: GNAT family N-acetyltransferase [Chlorobium sp.]|uniref:GNAT family N-acetyltransferase n=1 Tax=Chlorobium sp. TaxID=1095 RepID=UPI0025B90925|nr:GNAT family N-acetyltransferase [Chlorobium sp.]MCF8383430.1 GNAT family N-acetyltransferase [Chlorobium sp.]